jgi:SAM-dependent methyltransferase
MSMTLRQKLLLLLYRRLRPLAERAYIWFKSALPDDVQPLPSQANDTREVKVIDNLADLDAALLEVDQGFEISDDEARRRMASIHYVLKGDFPADPYSPEYAAAQMKTYLALSGRSSYQPEVNERSLVNFDWHKRWPFPYSTQSPTTVGEQLMAYGFVIRSMNLRAGASIVEFGPGFGELALHLARMGYRVTAVEIEKDYIELIRHHANMLHLDVALVQQDMATFEPGEQYDAALFYESFHHCADHLRLLRNQYAMIVPDGLIAFAAEPVADFPHPWGLVRPDGQTLWSIRKFGWFELGFDTSYFLRTLLLFGWLPRRYRSDLAHPMDVFVAHKSQGVYHPSELTLPPDEATTWAAPGPGYRFTSARSVMSCSRASPVRAIEFCLSNFAPSPLEVTVTAGRSAKASRRVKLPAQAKETVVSVEAEDWDGQVTIASPTWRGARADASADPGAVGVAIHWVRLEGGARSPAS